MRCVPFAILISLSFLVSHISFAQREHIEIAESMEDYIKEHHLVKVEDMVHRLAASKEFIDQFLLKEREINTKASRIKRKDVKIGRDIDLYVKHFSEHQNFTLMLVPISIYSLGIYDTLLFSVIEVSDRYLAREYPYDDYKIDSVKSQLLTLKNHSTLADHLYDRAFTASKSKIGKVSLHLNETFFNINTIHENLKDLDKKERAEAQRHWGLLKKAFSHNIEYHIEMNVYVFGFDDLEVKSVNKRGSQTYTITPSNIFPRHHFQEDQKQSSIK